MLGSPEPGWGGCGNPPGIGIGSPGKGMPGAGIDGNHEGVEGVVEVGVSGVVPVCVGGGVTPGSAGLALGGEVADCGSCSKAVCVSGLICPYRW